MAGAESLLGLRIDDLRGDAGDWVADRAGFVADLTFFAVDDIRRVYGDHRRELGAAVAFQDSGSESFLIRVGNLPAQFFRAGDQSIAAMRIALSLQRLK